MVFRNFRANVILRVLLFIIISGALVICIYEHLYLRSIYVSIALIIAAIEFIRFVDKTNRDFTAFLSALSQNDFTTTYAAQGKGKSFNSLYTAFNKITNKFRNISEQKEIQYIFLSLLVEHVRVGIISIDHAGKIHLINQWMKNYLSTTVAQNLSDLNLGNKDLVQVFRDIQVGENRMVKTLINGKLTPLTIHATELRMKDEYLKLISVQNIQNELEANELEAWQKLIRVLTHEIMNSISPIISLSSTLHQLVSSKTLPNNYSNSDQETLQKGLEAIKLRSHGLQHFADAYRSLTRVPQPQFRKVKVAHILDRLNTLFSEEIKERNIKLTITTFAEELAIIADPELLEQVLINVLRNAIEAVQQKKNPVIDLKVQVLTTTSSSIQIIDNGTGIPPDMIDKIFIPFFTTKKSGSGIGLALSNQIIQLHNGQISVYSESGVGTTVEIRL